MKFHCITACGLNSFNQFCFVSFSSSTSFAPSISRCIFIFFLLISRPFGKSVLDFGVDVLPSPKIEKKNRITNLINYWWSCLFYHFCSINRENERWKNLFVNWKIYLVVFFCRFLLQSSPNLSRTFLHSLFSAAADFVAPIQYMQHFVSVFICVYIWICICVGARSDCICVNRALQQREMMPSFKHFLSKEKSFSLCCENSRRLVEVVPS